MMNFRNLGFLSIVLLFLSCSNPIENNKAPITVIDSATKSVPSKDTIIPSQNAVETTVDNRFNNITAILSGQRGKANGLNYLFDTTAWSANASYIDSSWNRLEKKRLSAMKKWGSEEFKVPNSKTKVVFYPFSGPDYLTANAFFPNADTYIMLGLEPVGKLPDLEKFNGSDAEDYANDFKKSLGDIFDKSYFITRKMLNDFQSQKVNGLLPVLSFFIQKSGSPILDIKYLVRYQQDSIGEVDYDFKSADHKPFGVHVTFLKDGKQKSAYYFKYDVSNKLFNDTVVFYKFINEHTQSCITYIKSASYLLHANFMSNMRALILNNSMAIVQDDTGIPFNYFERENNFDIQLYGQYTKPVSDFPYLKLQKPLQDAFHRDSAKVKTMPFHLGYHWGTKKDIIIFAQKK